MNARTESGQVRILVLHPEDLMSATIGGIATFLRDFVRLAPPDLEIEVVGATSDSAERPVGQWQSWQVGGRVVRFLPLVPAAPPDHLSRFPVSLRFTLALAARRAGKPGRHRTLQFHRPEVPLALLRHPGPRVQLIHIDVQDGPQATRWRRVPAIYRAVENVTIPRMDRVFIANHAGVRLYRERYPERSDHVQFLSGWFNDDVFLPAEAGDRIEKRRALVQELGLPDRASDDRLVLHVGRLEAEKDPLLAIEAFARLHAAEPAAGPTGTSAVERLIVVGEGSLRPLMEHRAASAGVAGFVHFTGAQPQEKVARLMRSSDALLVTSRSEGGGPRVVVEALASGLPVVSTVVGEVETLIHDGRNGRLAHDRTPETLASGLREVLGLPRDAAASEAVAAAAPFAAPRVLAALYDAHRELAARGGRR